MDQAWLQRSLEHNRENQNSLWHRSLDLGSRAAAWALAANTAALVLCFNAVLSGNLCDWSALRPFALVLLLGTACAYLSILCEQRSFEAYSLQLAIFVADATTALGLLDQLKQIEQSDDNELNDEAMDFYRSTKSAFDAIKSKIDALDLAPSTATEWMKRSNWSLAASCVALGGATTAAIWYFPTSALCAS